MTLPGKPRARMTADSHVYWSCGRKHAFSKRTAIKIAAKLRRKSGEQIHAYACDHCGSHHVGHDPKGPT